MAPGNPAERDVVEQEISQLSDWLWSIVRQSEGDATADLVARVRELALDRRAGDPDAAEALEQLIGGLAVPELESLIAAFSIFFDLANLAEDRHRVRVLRQRQRKQGDQPRGESIADAFRRLRDAGVHHDRLREILEQTDIELVFTAHPTEAKRRSIREKMRDLRWHLGELDKPDLLPVEASHWRHMLVGDLFTLWHTDLLRKRKPTVLEEVKRALFFATTLWSVVPQLHDDIDAALREYFPQVSWSSRLPIRFGSWIGGDRDGHPGVTHEVTAETLQILRQSALDLHLEQCRQVRRSLSVSDKQTVVPAELSDALKDRLDRWPEVGPLVEPIAPFETCRRFLRVVQWRLRQTRGAHLAEAPPPGAYGDSNALLDDLNLLRRSIEPIPGGALVAVRLRRWIQQLKTFGFHLSRLDIRQESSWYRQVLSEAFAASGREADYAGLAEPQKQELLLRTLNERLPVEWDALSEPTVETWKLFRLLVDLSAAGAGRSLGIQIVSMTHAPSDVLAVLWLGAQAALARELDPQTLAMPIAPLLETIEDLRNAETILDALIRLEPYRRLVDRTGRQTVMVGYSDSTKDGGYLAATWNLYRGQSRLHDATARHGVGLTVFHGRGGALGRGGGPAARGILSLPPRTFDGSIRITEQGEVLAERYDDPAIAHRHLEQVTWASLLMAADPGVDIPSAWRDLMDRLADESQSAYRELIETPGFIPYFEQATPIAEIEQLPIGSRPSRRKAQRSLASLRAIPWVFSWTQNRCMLPAWYGMGTAFNSVQGDDAAATERLAAMYQQWPFFQATIDNAELALAKADMGIAQLYSALVDDDRVSGAIWRMIEAEFAAARAAILKLTRKSQLLDAVPWLQRSIAVRNPFVDPLNFIQMELLRRARSATDDRQADQWHHLARLTVQAISGGLRTTG